MRRSRIRGSIGRGARPRGRSWVGAVTMPPRSSRRRQRLEADEVQLGHELHAGRLVHAPPHELDRARTRRRRARPGSATKKLACFSDTTAPPTRRPLQPAASMSRPAESPGGLVNTEPAFCPPGWCSRRQRTISSMRAAHAAGSSRPTGERRGRRPPRRPAAPSGGSPSPSSAAAQLAHARRRRGRRPRASRSTSAVCAPWPPAFMRTAPPTDAGDARRRTRARRRRPPRCGGRAPGSGTAPPGAGTTPRCRAGSTSSCSNSPASTSATPANPSSATSRFEPRPTTSSGTPGRLQRVGDDAEVVVGARRAPPPRAGRRSGTS